MKFKLLITLFICFLQLIAYGQKLETPKERTVKVTGPDSTFYITISSEELASKKVKSDQRYYWFRKGELHSNVGHYEGELLHGEFKVFDNKNNLIVKGWFDKGLKINQWLYWDNAGDYLKKEDWKEGSLCGLVCVYDNKVLVSKSKYKNGEKCGAEILYSKEGKPIETKQYKNGLLHGASKNWQTKEVTKYKAGELVPEKVKKEKEPKPEKEKVAKEENKINKIKAFFKGLFPKKDTKEIVD